MKKKLLLIMSVVCLSISLCSCGDKKNDDNKSSNISNIEKPDSSTKDSEQKNDLSLEDVDNQLSEFHFGERTEMMASMIGAKNGFKYSDNDASYEVYEYDINSDAYKTLVDTGSIEVEGFDITMKATAINGKFVLFADEYADSSNLIETFNAIK